MSVGDGLTDAERPPTRRVVIGRDHNGKEIEALYRLGQWVVEGLDALAEGLPQTPSARLRFTSTYATTDIVIDTVGLTIWAQDFGFDTPEDWTNPFRERAGVFISRNHVRVFTDMGAFTTWLHEAGAVVDQCWMLGATLSDEERVPNTEALNDRGPSEFAEVGQVGDDVHLTERPAADQDAAQAAFVRKCRDQLVGAIAVAHSAGLMVQVWGIENLWSTDDDKGTLPLEVAVVREL